MRLAWFLAPCSALVLATPARALDLDWHAPATCPDGASVTADVARRLGRSVADVASIELQVRATVVESDARPHLTLEIASARGGGERRLEAEDCQTLARAAAIIVALAIDPSVVDARDLEAIAAAPEGEAPGEATQRPPEPRAEPVPARVRERDPAAANGDAAASEPLDVHLLLRMELVGDLGTLDAPGLGLGGAVGLAVARWRVEANVAYLPPADAEFGGRSAPVAELELLGAGITGCRALVDRVFTAGPCLAVEAGNMWGRGQNLSLQQRGNALWVAALAGGRVTWWVTEGLGATLALELGLPLLRTLFTVEGLGTVHETSGPFGRVRLGIEGRL